MALNSREPEKQSLMKRLLDSVKQCQIRFGGKTELATEIDSRVSCLCSAWEAIVQHGMKHSHRTLSALKQMTEMAGLSKIGLLEDVKNMETEPAFWQYVKQHLSDHELLRYTRLRHVTTDAGRGRAWIRAALNEHSLERYMHMLIEDDKLLCAFYEDWAFLRDPEKQHVLPNAAAGLKSVLFAISIDNEELNAIRPARGFEDIVQTATGALSSPPSSNYTPGAEEPRPVIGGHDPIIEKKKERKKKKKVPKIVSFDEAVSETTSGPWGSSAKQNTFTSASLPCTPALSTTRFDTFSGSETARSYSSESSASSLKTDESPRTQNCAVNVVVENDSPGIKMDEPLLASNVLNNSNITKQENPESKQSAYVDTKSSLVTQSISKSENTRNRDNFVHLDSGIKSSSGSLLHRVSSKTSLDSVVSVKSSRSEADVMPRSLGHNRGHKKSHSDTSMFSNIGSKLFKSVIAVSKRTFSSDSESIDSSLIDPSKSLDEHSIDDDSKTNRDVFSEASAAVKHSPSVGSFDNVSLGDIDKQFGNQRSMDSQSEDQLSIYSGSRLTITGESVPVTLPSVLPPSVQSKNNIMLAGQEQLNTTNNYDMQPRQVPEKRVLHHSLSAGAIRSQQQSQASFSNSIYGNDYEEMVPIAQDGHLMTDIVVRPDNSGIYSSSPSGSLEMPGYMDTTRQANFALALAQQSVLNSEKIRTQGDGSHFPDPAATCSSGSQDGMTTQELKEAIIAMMRRKDEVDEENRHIRLALDGELEVCNTLRLELSEAKKSHQNQQERDNKKITDLSRENELLKHQLRKYVSAVQMLRRQGAPDAEFAGLHLDDVQPAVPALNINTDYIQEASDYESKLIQVAEMHGELMEFNEFLQKQLIAKDKLITDMQQELVDLRGPLPDNMPNAEDDWSIISEMDGPSGNRPLVNVWIPAAFMKGSSSNKYHVYQVYLRIRDEEWNVYRRYAEFLELHTLMKKRNPIVASFQFPPKKAIGNKDEKFVEARRKQLQVYLRKVINLIVHINASLSVEINRHRLTQTLPFFGDGTVTKKEARRSSQPSSRGRKAAARQQSQQAHAEPQYSGL